jgi:hypothetical protein
MDYDGFFETKEKAGQFSPAFLKLYKSIISYLKTKVKTIMAYLSTKNKLSAYLLEKLLFFHYLKIIKNEVATIIHRKRNEYQKRK